jgi:DNA polymerase
MYLPSGGRIVYPYPRVINTTDRKGRIKQQVVFRDNANNRWLPCRGGQGFYGGSWFENLIQAIARDILAEALVRLENAGFPVILHVHDEVLCEVPVSFGSLEQFHKIFVRPPVWTDGLPIAAPDCWSGPRFCKPRRRSPSPSIG